MRILLHDYSGHPFQVQLARELARRGHQVLHLFSAAISTPRGALARMPGDPAGFDVRAIDPGEPLAKYSYVKRFLQERRYGSLLRAELEAFAPDAVLMSNTPPDAMVAPQKWARARKVGFVFWVQDVYCEAIARILRQKLGPLAAPIGWHYTNLESGLLRRSDAVVAITEDFRPLLEKWDVRPDTTHVIENWAPLQELPPRPKDNPFAREHGLHDKLVYLYSGTLGLKHNPALLAALAERFRDRPDVRVVVVSEGLGADFLKARKVERGLDGLLLLPFQPFDRMPDMLGSADVLMAILEPDAGVYSVPSKVLTYLCAGRALLAAIPPENLAARTIHSRQAGLTVAPNDEPGFVAAADRLATGEGLRAQLGANARKYAETAFDIAAIGARFEQILQSASRR